MMMICNDCGHVFSDDDIFYHRFHESGFNVPDGGYDEVVAMCPNCHSESIEKAGVCEVCGEGFYTEEMVGNVCKQCLRNIIIDQPTLAWEFISDPDNDTLDNFAEWIVERQEKLRNA